MKKTSFIVAILVSAALAACHGKKANTAPTGGGSGSGEMGSGSAEAGSGSAEAPAGGEGSAKM